jgi:hypothetical protein
MSIWRRKPDICAIWKNEARICKRFRSPGIDSEESIPPAYVVRRAETTNRVVVPARQAENRFLGSLKCLQIRAQACCLTLPKGLKANSSIIEKLAGYEETGRGKS